jgi:hypothetical protein
VFARAGSFVDCACADLAETEAPVVLARIRYGANQSIRAAARAAQRHCEPRALALARRLHPEARFLTYRNIVRDTSGRIAQLVDTCPGLLLLCAAAEDVSGTRGIIEATLAGVRNGNALSRIVRTAVESLLDRFDIPGDWLSQAVAAIGRDRVAHNAALLVRRAAPLVPPRLVIAPAPLAFAPEDIPSAHAANAEWYSVMPGLVRALGDMSPDVATATSMFVSRHVHVVAAAGKHLNPLGASELGIFLGRVERIARTLALYANETGRRPRRCSNPVRYIARARRWIVQERNGGSPLYRVGKLIDRMRSFDLGPVVGVTFLSDEARWAEADENLSFPGFPRSAVRVPGVDVAHIADARTLAAEGRDMNHCVASALAEAAAGELFLFSVRTAASRLTLALEPRSDATYAVAELRGVSDRDPSARERDRVEAWVAAINQCVRETSRGVRK